MMFNDMWNGKVQSLNPNAPRIPGFFVCDEVVHAALSAAVILDDWQQIKVPAVACTIEWETNSRVQRRGVACTPPLFAVGAAEADGLALQVYFAAKESERNPNCAGSGLSLKRKFSRWRGEATTHTRRRKICSRHTAEERGGW